MPTAPKLYVQNRSVKLPAGGGGGDGVLYWSASYDPDGGTCRYRVFKVTGFTANDPDVGAVLEEADLTLAATGDATPAWIREELGYGWPTYSSLIPNVDGSSVPTPSGLYAIQVRQATGAGGSWTDVSTAYFVVRRTPSATDKVVVCYPFSTTVAYAGAWGEHENLYDSYQWQRTRRVSTERPLGITKLKHTVKYPFAMEAFIRAYDSGSLGVDVCTSFDIQQDPSFLDDYNLLVSVGHDEYWSKEMSDAVKAFVAAGGNVAFFSANTAWWQVRFEESNTRMVCFKSAVEDTGSDQSALTGNFCSPPSIEENLLTGVSYRRGTQGFSSTPYTKLTGANSDPYGYLTGVSATFGPTGLFDLETDAAEYAYDEQTKTYLATGVDGSPLNFEVLAAADMRTQSLAQRGMATLGYFTNVGTVFTAATTEWAGFLGNSDIATITTNVLADLRTRHTRSAWTKPTRTYPTTTWQSLGAVSGTLPALCGIVEGHLVYQAAATSTLLRRDPENPASSATLTSIPLLSGMLCFGSDLWGKNIYGGATDGKVYFRSGSIHAGDSWSNSWTIPDSGWVPKGIGAHDGNAFVLAQSSVDSRLYRSVNGVWTRLSRIYPPIRPITSFDGKLFGVRDPGSSDSDPLDLYCREASEVDLTWTKIGTAPAGTYALAAYYGRLFALAGTSTVDPTLFWRSTLGTTSLPYRGPSVLFVTGSSFAIARVSSDGDVLTTGSGTLSFSYTHITRANDGLVLFYNAADGSAQLIRFEADGSYTVVRTHSAGYFGSGWTHIVYLRAGYRSWTDLSPVAEKVLFYDSSSTTAYVGHFDADGYFVSDWSSSSFATGWTKIACTYKGDVLFYNGSTGAYAYGAVDASGAYYGAGSGSGMATGWDAIAPAGHTFLLFYKTTGTATLVELFGGVTSLHGYTLDDSLTVVGAENGSVITNGPGDGSAQVLGFSGASSASSAKVLLRGYPESAFSTGWAHVVPVGIL